MNKYLEKIAKQGTETRPYRSRVEVLITNGDKVLLMENKNPNSGETWYGFPGGGTDGDTERDACIKECLEEVGVRIKNVNDSGVDYLEEGMGNKEGRDKIYRGSHTKWFTAEFHGDDHSLYGEGNDARKYVWKSPSEALEALQSHRPIATHRSRVITSLKASK